MSRCPSSVYNYQQFSQSQKVSIGVVADSVASQPKKQSKSSNTHAAVEKEPSNAQRFTVKHNADQGVNALAANLTIKHTGPHKKRTSSSATANSLCDMQPTNYVRAAQTEALSECGVGKKIDADNISHKEGKMSGIGGRSENFSSVCKQADVSVKEVIQQQIGGVEDRNKETLRMNLRQILGANLFSHDKVDNAKSLDVSTHTTIQEPNAKVDHHSKPKQNSDTIETDSENASLTTKRPVTKPLARNKAPVAGRTRNLKPKLSCEKEVKQGNSTSSCAKKSVPYQSCAVNRGCLMTEWTDCSKKSYGIKPGDLLSPTTEVNGCEKLTVKEMPVQSFTRPPALHDDCLNDNIELTMQDVNLNRSPVISEKHQLLHSEYPVRQDKSEHHESFGFQTHTLQDDGSDPPLFNMRTVLNSPVDLFPVINDESQRLHQSPHEAGRSIFEDKCVSFSSSSTENVSDSSDDTATPDDRYAISQDLSINDKHPDDEIFTPGRGEPSSTEEVSPMKRAYTEDVQTSPEIGLVEKPMFFLNKRRRNEDVNFDDFSPSFTMPKAGGIVDDVLTEASEENADDELARVISLLGLALEEVKNKMALATNRRCSDILMSAAGKIHSQLQDVESQIQTDLGKLTCLKVSKRKHLETRLQEQQEHLKVIHQKFKEEILEYLQDCRGAEEGLETQHIELNGALETQKASHRKLFAQAEAAVENHIVDTQRKIMSVHKMGKKKMQQLKVAVGECLKDVISG